MKKNNKNGITMIALVVTIILLMIIAGVAITQGSDVLENANLQTINTNMLLVQAKVKTIAEKHAFDETTNPLIGIELSQMQENEKLQKLIEKGILTRRRYPKHIHTCMDPGNIRTRRNST